MQYILSGGGITRPRRDTREGDDMENLIKELEQLAHVIHADTARLTAVYEAYCAVCHLRLQTPAVDSIFAALTAD